MKHENVKMPSHTSNNVEVWQEPFWKLSCLLFFDSAERKTLIFMAEKSMENSSLDTGGVVSWVIWCHGNTIW